MIDKIAGWLNEDDYLDGTTATNGDFLRAFIEKAWMFVVEVLNYLGEWPIK